MGGATVGDATETRPADGETSLTMHYTPTLSELIKANAALGRAGVVVNGFGGYAAMWTAIGLMAGAPLPVLLPTTIFAIAGLTGYYCAPVLWYAVWRRRDLVITPVTVTLDSDGVEARTASASGRQAWSFYRRARDLGDSVALEAGASIAMLLLTRGLPAADRSRLTRMLREHGLIRPSTLFERARPFVAIGIGAIVALIQFSLRAVP